MRCNILKLKTLLLVSLCLWGGGLFAGPINKNFTVLTFIDTDEFVTAMIEVYFKDTELYPSYNDDTNTFYDISTIMYVKGSELDPRTANQPYNLALESNEATCYMLKDPGGAQTEVAIPSNPIDADYDYKNTIATPYVDADELKSSPPLTLTFDDTATNVTEKIDEYTFTLKFKPVPVPASGEEVTKCEGFINVQVEFVP